MTDPFGWALLDARGLFVTFIRSEDLAKETVHTLNVGSGIPQIRPFRLTPLAEIPAWQPIETAPRDGSVFILGWPGGRAPGFWCQSFGRFSALPGNAELPPGKMQGFYPFDEWTHWQPLPAPPKEAPDAKS